MSLGSMLGGLLPSGGPSRGPQFPDPQLFFRSAGVSDYGTPVPLCFGTVRVRGLLVWLTAEYTAQKVPDYNADGSLAAYHDRDVATVQLGFCEGPITAFTGTYWRNDVKVANSAALASVWMPIETTLGPRTQACWPHLAAKSIDPWYKVGFGGTALMRSAQFYLPDSRFPTVDAEITGFCATSGNDALPSDVVTYLLSDSIVGFLPASTVEVAVGLDGQAASSFARWCAQASWRVAANLTQRRSIIDILGDLLGSCNARATWTGDKVHVVPLADTTVGTYTPAPIVRTLTLNDFRGGTSDEPVSIRREPDATRYGFVPVKFQARAADYIEQTEAYRYRHEAAGTMAAESVVSEWLKTAATAAKLSSLLILQNVHCRNRATFHLGFKHIDLLPGDLVRLTEPHSGLDADVYRIERIEISGDSDKPIRVEAIEWPIGVGTPMADAGAQSADGIAAPFPVTSPPTGMIQDRHVAGNEGLSMTVHHSWSFGGYGGVFGVPVDAGWALTNYTGTTLYGGTAREYTASAANPSLKIEGVDLYPVWEYIFKARFRLPAASDALPAEWVGKVYWRTGTNAYDDTHSRRFGSGQPGEWALIVLDLRFLDDGTESDFMTGGSVTGIKIVFSSGNGRKVQIDWIATGYTTAALGNAPVSNDVLTEGARLAGDNMWPNPTSEIAPTVGEVAATPDFANRYEAGASAYAGAWVRKLTATGDTTATLDSFAVACMPGDVFDLTAQALKAAGTGAVVKVKLTAYDKDNAATGSLESSPTTSASWVPLAARGFYAPAGSVRIKASLILDGLSGSSEGWFDAIGFRKARGWNEYSASVSAYSASGSGTRTGAGTLAVTTSSVTASPHNASGSVTYAWQYVSGDTFTVNAPTSAATTFSKTATLGDPPDSQSFGGGYRCKVTDADGNVTYTATVTVSTTHSN